jgi:hypothetical protein
MSVSSNSDAAARGAAEHDAGHGVVVPRVEAGDQPLMRTT